MERINLDNLKVGYKNPVVEDVSFRVKPGQIVALIGPNGSGKSTILKTITMQLKKLSGRLFICGDIDKSYTEAELSKRMSMVMTERIHPELMTCLDVVATGRYPYTGRLGFLSYEDKEKVEEAIRLVGAEDVADKDFMKISDGQRQRVMLARAIAQEPEIMILDEPTSFLDIQYKIDILSVIKKLATERKIAVIMSIHELEFVPAIADKVIGICDGQVYKMGNPEEIFKGEIIEHLYGMPRGTGDTYINGLIGYSNAIEDILKAAPQGIEVTLESDEV